MSAKHTPGPWATNSQYGNGKRVPIVSYGHEDRDAIAWVDCDDVPEDEAQANVALISAAPDLLDAAEQIAAAELRSAHGEPGGWIKALAQLRAAIAKARGGA